MHAVADLNKQRSVRGGGASSSVIPQSSAVPDEMSVTFVDTVDSATSPPSLRTVPVK